MEVARFFTLHTRCWCTCTRCHNGNDKTVREPFLKGELSDCDIINQIVPSLVPMVTVATLEKMPDSSVKPDPIHITVCTVCIIHSLHLLNVSLLPNLECPVVIRGSIAAKSSNKGTLCNSCNQPLLSAHCRRTAQLAQLVRAHCRLSVTGLSLYAVFVQLVSRLQVETGTMVVLSS